MTERELNITLREMAHSVGLCDEWYGEWKDDSTLDECLDRYVRGHDFAIKNDWPPLEFCRNNFSREDLHRHHIYIDEEVDIWKAESGTWIFLGECSGRIYFEDFSVGTVYVRHSSDIFVHVCDMAKVFVSIYEDGDAKIIKENGTVAKLYDRRK